MKNKKIGMAIIFLCLVCSGCTVILLELFSDVFGRFDGQGPFDSWVVNYPREEIFFYSGNNKLQGFIYGAGNNKGLVVISPGIYSYADEYDKMIRFLIDNEWRVFSYNCTGVDGSEGDSMRGLSQGILDLDAALRYIGNSNDLLDLPVMLMGFSWGGFSVCAALEYDHNITAVVSFAGFNSTQEAMKHQLVEEVGGVFYVISSQLWALEKQLFGETAKLTAVDGINKSGIPVMLVLCENDDIIPPDTISIYAHKDKINNPNFQSLYLEGEEAYGHYFKNYPEGKELYDRVNEFLGNSLD
ncbi:MAG: alpha/beta hydrolase [Treponema sp.]|nr:alpha/beta hydrolase [Treponema sp.]MCL2237118.1 alpha/beta hydrolase [Treponema sp.]